MYARCVGVSLQNIISIANRRSNIPSQQLRLAQTLVMSQLESVKGSGNSAFLQKDQLCYLKKAQKLTFCIFFS